MYNRTTVKKDDPVFLCGRQNWHSYVIVFLEVKPVYVMCCICLLIPSMSFLIVDEGAKKSVQILLKVLKNEGVESCCLLLSIDLLIQIVQNETVNAWKERTTPLQIM